MVSTRLAAARRTNATSLYAAPLYGPALRYLGLLQANLLQAGDHIQVIQHLAQPLLELFMASATFQQSIHPFHCRVGLRPIALP